MSRKEKEKNDVMTNNQLSKLNFTHCQDGDEINAQSISTKNYYSFTRILVSQFCKNIGANFEGCFFERHMMEIGVCMTLLGYLLWLDSSSHESTSKYDSANMCHSLLIVSIIFILVVSLRYILSNLGRSLVPIRQEVLIRTQSRLRKAYDCNSVNFASEEGSSVGLSSMKDDAPRFFNLSKQSQKDKGKEKTDTIRNRMGNISATHWYTDAEIDKLFKVYFSENSEVEYLGAMLATNTSNKGTALSDNLAQFNEVRMEAISQGKEVKDRVLVPINLNLNHWALLNIVYEKDASKLPDIHYFDPLGSEATDELKMALQSGFSLRNLSDINIIPITRRVQNDGYNCGPWIVEAARAIAQDGSVPMDFFDINQARADHMKIISSDAFPHETSQNQETNSLNKTLA